MKDNAHKLEVKIVNMMMHNVRFEWSWYTNTLTWQLASIYSAITTKSKIFAPLFLYDPVGWLLQFFIGRKNMY